MRRRSSIERTFVMQFRKLVVGGLVLGAPMTAGIAYAAIPDASGVIHGCYVTAGNPHKLKVSDTSSCPSGYTTLRWSPVTIAAGHHKQAIGPLSQPGTTIATLTIPKGGSYAVSAKVMVTNTSGSMANDSCSLLGPTFANEDTAVASVPPGGDETVPLQNVDTFAAGATVSLICGDMSTVGGQAASFARITAISATTLTDSAL
jgi:hypothetical protein